MKQVNYLLFIKDVLNCLFAELISELPLSLITKLSDGKLSANEQAELVKEVSQLALKAAAKASGKYVTNAKDV